VKTEISISWPSSGTIFWITQWLARSGRYSELRQLAIKRERSFGYTTYPKKIKETKFIHSSFVDQFDEDIHRKYTQDTSHFSLIPGASISYWVPKNIRELYTAETVLDADNAELSDRETIGVVKQGLATGNDGRFLDVFGKQILTKTNSTNCERRK